MTNNSGKFIMAGFAGEAACLSTAIDAFHRGHHVTYLADASASHGLGDRPSAEVHDFVRQLIGTMGERDANRILDQDNVARDCVRKKQQCLGAGHEAT